MSLRPATVTTGLRILMLHGFTQSADRFRTQTQPLIDTLKTECSSPIDFVYANAPIALSRNELPLFDIGGARRNEAKEDAGLDAYSWWRIAGSKPHFRYEGIEAAFEHIADVIKTEGPFNGAIGFSQGAAAVAMLASLLEPGRRAAFDRAEAEGGMPHPAPSLDQRAILQPPLKFAVALSGFSANSNPLYRAFYQPPIITPILHVVGRADTFIRPERTQELIDTCTNSTLVYHPGGHAVPSDAKSQQEVVAFVKANMAQ